MRMCEIILGSRKPRIHRPIKDLDTGLLLLFSRSFCKSLVNMADNRGKRKAWVFCKESKIPRTTAWRSKTNGKESDGSSSASDSVSLITTLHHVEETARDRSSCTFDKAACNGDFESDHVSPQSPSCPTDSDHFNEPLFCDEQSNDDSTNEFVSLLVDTESNSATSDEESESEIFQRTDSSSGNSSSDDSEKENETSDVIEDLEMDEEKTSDDDVPLYEGANVSKLCFLA